VARKLDDDAAFQYYVSLGDDRSYRAVARHYKVCPRSIRNAAKRGDWVIRLDRIEKEARERMEQRLVETRVETRERHLRMLRAMATRGLQALQRHELGSALEGVRAIAEAIKLERVILGEPSEHVGLSVAELTRREVETFLAHPEEAEGEVDGGPA